MHHCHWLHDGPPQPPQPQPPPHLVAPLPAPRVLDQPVGQVVRAVVCGAVAHHQHAVVQGGAALGVKHAAHVQLEGALQQREGGGRERGGRARAAVSAANTHTPCSALASQSPAPPPPTPPRPRPPTPPAHTPRTHTPHTPPHIRTAPHLVVLVQRADVVLEGVCHPAVLQPHVRHTLQRVPGVGAAPDGCSSTRSSAGQACVYVVGVCIGWGGQGVGWQHAACIASIHALLPASVAAAPSSSSRAARPPHRPALPRRTCVEQVVKVLVVREDDVAAHVKQESFWGDVGAGQAARLGLLQRAGRQQQAGGGEPAASISIGAGVPAPSRRRRNRRRCCLGSRRPGCHMRSALLITASPTTHISSSSMHAGSVGWPERDDGGRTWSTSSQLGWPSWFRRVAAPRPVGPDPTTSTPTCAGSGWWVGREQHSLLPLSARSPSPSSTSWGAQAHLLDAVGCHDRPAPLLRFVGVGGARNEAGTKSRCRAARQ